MSTTEETPKKKSTSRADAGLVEADAEIQPQDEAIAAGEAFPEEALEEGVFTESAPSALRVSGMSEEEQSMDMTPVIVGPPAYGSPDPITAGGRLLPLDQHPFNPENLPEDHPARIDPDYGKGYQADLSPDEIGSQFPGAPGRTDLETDLLGTAGGGDGSATTQAADQAAAYETMTVADLKAEADSRGLTGLSNASKADLISALQADDAAHA